VTSPILDLIIDARIQHDRFKIQPNANP